MDFVERKFAARTAAASRAGEVSPGVDTAGVLGSHFRMPSFFIIIPHREPMTFVFEHVRKAAAHGNGGHCLGWGGRGKLGPLCGDDLISFSNMCAGRSDPPPHRSCCD
jgi:hypothetical protein